MLKTKNKLLIYTSTSLFLYDPITQMMSRIVLVYMLILNIEYTVNRKIYTNYKTVIKMFSEIMHILFN